MAYQTFHTFVVDSIQLEFDPERFNSFLPTENGQPGVRLALFMFPDVLNLLYVRFNYSFAIIHLFANVGNKELFPAHAH